MKTSIHYPPPNSTNKELGQRRLKVNQTMSAKCSWRLNDNIINSSPSSYTKELTTASFGGQCVVLTSKVIVTLGKKCSQWWKLLTCQTFGLWSYMGKYIYANQYLHIFLTIVDRKFSTKKKQKPYHRIVYFAKTWDFQTTYSSNHMRSLEKTEYI